MKKFLALVLVLVMMLSLAACGGKSFTVVVADLDGNETTF